jgi:hypothetical protein
VKTSHGSTRLCGTEHLDHFNPFGQLRVNSVRNLSSLERDGIENRGRGEISRSH